MALALPPPLPLRAGGEGKGVGKVKFRRKPVEVEAKQLTKANWRELEAWSGAAFIGNRTGPGEDDLDCLGLLVPSLEGKLFASIGDWIIRDVKGEFYPCKPDIFDATYEPVEGE